MTFKDLTGQPLQQGDRVLISVGLGQMSVATITRTESGLNPANPQPAVVLQVEFILPVMPNGLVGGVVKVADSAPQVSS